MRDDSRVDGVPRADRLQLLLAVSEIRFESRREHMLRRRIAAETARPVQRRPTVLPSEPGIDPRLWQQDVSTASDWTQRNFLAFFLVMGLWERR
jgi:hypothetical protein